LFTTGIGIHYAETSIVNTKYQSIASGLVIGQRVLPQVFLRAADSRPYEIQDLIVSDTRFKVLVFVGDTSDAGQRDRLTDLAGEMKDVLSPYAPGGDVSKVFDILTFGTTRKEKVLYNDVPPFFRSHWSK
jgi:phenol 2-monooxygenase